MSGLNENQLPTKNVGDLESSPPGKKTSVGSNNSTQYSQSSTLVDESLTTPVVVKFSCQGLSAPDLTDDYDSCSEDDTDWNAEGESDWNHEQAIANEAELYSVALRDLQGSVVPRFHGLWKTTHEGKAVWMMVLDKLSSKGVREEDTMMHQTLDTRCVTILVSHKLGTCPLILADCLYCISILDYTRLGCFTTTSHLATFYLHQSKCLIPA